MVPITSAVLTNAVSPGMSTVHTAFLNGSTGGSAFTSTDAINTGGITPGSFSPQLGTMLPGQSGEANKTPFADLLSEAVGQVDQLDKKARSSVEGLISGQGVDVHEAMIATEKAEMGFELMLSVRNKALAAYQQVIGMQF